MPKKGEPMSEEQKAKLRAAVRAKQAPQAPQEAPQETQPIPMDPEDQTDAVRAVLAAESVQSGNVGDLSAVMAMLAQAIGQAQSANNEGLVKALEESQKRLQAKENPVPPLVSAFNNRGDRDFPRPRLKCREVTQCGFPVQESACTVAELEILNRFIDSLVEARRNHEALPVYRITKADGSMATVRLETSWNDVSGGLERLAINYPVKTHDMRSGLYSFEHMLGEMLGIEQPQVDTVALIARVRQLESENQQLRMAGV
jgi:hypothetical protein